MTDENAVLIVDDSPDDAQVLLRAIKDAGIPNPVHVVTDGAQAISYFQGEGIYSDSKMYPPARIVFLDLKMPVMDGFQVLDWLNNRTQLGSKLVIVLTGIHDLKEVDRAYKKGAHSFLVKPCNAVDIKNLVKAFPDRWGGSIPGSLN
ncbi:MAG: putative response regulator, CheY [Pedosphaera sp.]|jgi:CheY-like chemotaxis protein|nr:putative response regulator, CheY [Pedosphaera sp.]